MKTGAAVLARAIRGCSAVTMTGVILPSDLQSRKTSPAAEYYSPRDPECGAVSAKTILEEVVGGRFMQYYYGLLVRAMTFERPGWDDGLRSSKCSVNCPGASGGHYWYWELQTFHSSRV